MDVYHYTADDLTVDPREVIRVIHFWEHPDQALSEARPTYQALVEEDFVLKVVTGQYVRSSVHVCWSGLKWEWEFDTHRINLTPMDALGLFNEFIQTNMYTVSEWFLDHPNELC